MINSNADSAMGILFPNSYDSLVPELVTERLMASIPFAQMPFTTRTFPNHRGKLFFCKQKFHCTGFCGIIIMLLPVFIAVIGST